MDGVIADTAPYHFAAWREAFREHGVDYTEAMFRHNFGRRNDAIIKNILGDHLPPERIASIDLAKEEGFRRLARGKLQALPGAVALVRALKARCYPLAIGSSAPLENIEIILADLGILACFNAIVSSRDVTEGKPDPQVFLIAAQKLGRPPGDCTVIEDAVAGVAAAKRGGMRCIAVTNTHPRGKLGQADLVVDSLEALTVEAIAGLWPDANNDRKGVLSNMEKSLILVKPDATQRHLTGAILAKLEAAGLNLVAVKMLQMDKKLAERHYAVHKEKPFFPGLVAYITSGPIVAAVFTGDDAVARIRKVMGNTNPAKADKGTIRGDFGVDIEKNAVHGSDSVENARIEISLFFAGSEVIE